jgi:hypothetical protein
LPFRLATEFSDSDIALREQNDALIEGTRPPLFGLATARDAGTGGWLKGQLPVLPPRGEAPQDPYNKAVRAIPKFYFVINILVAGARPPPRRKTAFGGRVAIDGRYESCCVK